MYRKLNFSVMSTWCWLTSTPTTPKLFDQLRMPTLMKMCAYSVTTARFLPIQYTMKIGSIWKSKRWTPWRNKFPRGFILRNSLLVQFLCILGRTFRAIFGHCLLLAIVRATLPYFFAQQRAPKRHVPLRKNWLLPYNRSECMSSYHLIHFNDFEYCLSVTILTLRIIATFQPCLSTSTANT